MESKRTVGFTLVAHVFAGLLAIAAACGGERTPTSGQAGNASGSESVGGRDAARRDAAAAGTAQDAATSSETDTGVAAPDAGVERDAGAQPEIDASVPTSCDLTCAAGERCELVQVTCIRAPCPPLPSCVKIEPVSCDPRLILCRRAPPECPQWHVPSVSGSCFGPCVPVEQCACDEPADCPDPDHFTCHRSAAHCGPYVQ